MTRLSKSASAQKLMLHWDWLVLGAMVGLWSIAVGWVAIARHLALGTGFDLGVFAQVVWATAQGRPFYTSLIDETTRFLGYHFTPFLVVLAPLYSIWPDARLLLTVQAVAVAVGAIPLFAFARPRLGPGRALAVVTAYFLSPLLHYVAPTDFHAIALSVPLLMAAGAALLDDHPKAMMVWLGLALLVKEEIALIAVGFGLYVLLIQRKVRLGAALTLGTGLWAALLFGLVMPALGQTGGNYTFVRRYGSLGDTPVQMLRTLLTRPAAAINVVATRAKARFLWQILAPLAGLPLLGLPAVLLTLPTLAYLLLSDYGLQASIEYHYTAPLIPFLFLATVVALQRLDAYGPRLGRIGAIVLLVAALVSAWWWSPLPGGRSHVPTRFATTEESQAARALLAGIPPDASVVSDWAFLPWLANRWQIDMMLVPPFQLTAPNMSPDYLLTQTLGPGAVSAPLYPWIVAEQPGDQLHVPRFAAQSTTPGGLTLWKWRGLEQDVTLSRYDVSFEHGLALVAAGLPPEAPPWGPVIAVELGTTLPIWMAWAAHDPLAQRVTFTLQLFDEDGVRISQVDQEMGGGHFPTTRWHEWLDNPIVVGEFRLPIPPDVAPGRYRLLVGAYESESVVPLIRPDGTSWFELTTLEVGQPAQSLP